MVELGIQENGFLDVWKALKGLAGNGLKMAVQGTEGIPQEKGGGLDDTGAGTFCPDKPPKPVTIMLTVKQQK